MFVGKPKRRGVVILIVLSLLVLFALVGVTFALLAGQYLRAAKASSRLQQAGDDPIALLDAAFYTALADAPDGTECSILGHSLLRDLYGATDSVKARVKASTATVVDGEFLQFTAELAIPKFHPAPGYYNGCVFTFREGPLANYSTRVVSYVPNGSLDSGPSKLFTVASEATMRVELMSSDLADIATRLGNATLLERAVGGKEFVINGRACNGTGFGWDATAGNLTLDSSGGGFPDALLPVYTAAPAGDADEDFDVPDYRDMWLAFVQSGATNSRQVLPSFHRPELVAYWQARDSSQVPLACMRPLPTLHRDFSGSNPYFDGITDEAELARRLSAPADADFRWDVDNDRDGIYDSVWVDVGLPPKKAANGRTYKPLVAFLIRDLDGRLNLNAHGHLKHSGADFTSNNVTETLAGGQTSAAIARRGGGFGPAEVRLDAVLGAAEANNMIAGRDGADNQPGTATEEATSRLRQVGRPAVYGPLSAYGAPPDVYGRGAVALDPNGLPYFFFMGRDDELTNDPYEFNPAQPYSETAVAATEFEALLRPYDTDTAAIYSRLWTPNLYSANLNSLTFASFDLPVPAALPPTEVRASISGGSNPSYVARLQSDQEFSLSIVDLYALRLHAGGFFTASRTNTEFRQQLGLMVPPEFMRGHRFDVNRLWGNGVDGNGRDDDGDGLIDEGSDLIDNNMNGTVDEPAERETDQNGTVDDPAELTGTENVFTDVITGPPPGVTANYANDYPRPDPQVSVSDPLNSAVSDKGRQIYARYLYCLAMLLVDENYKFPTQGNITDAAQLKELKARRLAQWAVNCVDFRDPDAIMTPFEYDVDPFDDGGWQTDIDGNPGTVEATDRRLVWGMEYPDLLLTETLAFHDRRVDDKDADTGGASDHARKNSTGTAIRDADLDQVRVPEGSLFLEFYCPRPFKVAETEADNARNGQRPAPPAELYQLVTDAGNQYAYLDLGKLAPAGGGLQYPVWRVAISERHDANAANFADKSAAALTGSIPDSVTYEPAALDVLSSKSATIDRIVWFTNTAPTSHIDAAKIFYRKYAFSPVLPTSDTNTDRAWLPGGRYAVVGPRKTTYVSRLTNSTGPSAQKIEFNVDTTGGARENASTNKVQISYSGGTHNLGGKNFSVPLMMIAAQDLPGGWANDTGLIGFGTRGAGLNVSEPLSHTSTTYYPAPDATLSSLPVKDGYATAKDKPIDTDTTAAPVTPLELHASLATTGTKLDYRTAYVQRLANPLAAFDAVTNPYITVDWMPIDLTVFNGESKRPDTWDNNMPAGIGEWDKDSAHDPSPPVKFAARVRNGASVHNLFSVGTTEPPATTTNGASDTYFNYNAQGTFGLLNPAFGSGGTTTEFVGAPATPFPWLAWNNRPYRTGLELMLVPSSSQGRALLEFSTERTSNNAYAYNAGNDGNAFSPYAHLLNFFQGTPLASGNRDTSKLTADLARLVDYLETPSPFVGTQWWYNPATNTNNTLFKPPFNKLTRYRDPGKVNLNTISDPRVLSAIMGVDVTVGSPSIWDKFQRSRDGRTGTLTAYPTAIANPFRSASGADLAPLANLRHRAAEATLLRSDPDAADKPLFRFEDTTDAYERSDRNAFFRYEPLTRLANLTTTRSNVFAVWVTVGFFEYDESARTLGRELGSDTGDVKRHRAFYLVDRSIPVMYHGKAPDHIGNVDRCVLVRRYLE